MNKRLILSLLAPAIFATAAARGESEKPLSLVAFGSCCHQSRAQAFWDPIIKAKPDAFIFAGDNIYSDTYDIGVMKHKYAQLASQIGFRHLKVTCPVLATWDDHDYGLNDSGGEFPAKKATREVFLNFWGVPKKSPRRGNDGVYDATTYGPKGKRIQIILLDTRYNRSPLAQLPVRSPGKGRYTANRATNATILGEEQWAWLEKQLRQPADLRLLVSSIQIVAQDHNWEKWMNFPNERPRLLRLIHATKANGLIVLSGDRHHSELSMLRSALTGYPLYDLTSSGLNMTHVGMQYEPNRYRVGRQIVLENNYGAVSVDWTKSDPMVTLEIRTVSKKTPISESFPLSTLEPRSN